MVQFWGRTPGCRPRPTQPSPKHLRRPASSMASRQASRPSATTPIWWLCPKAQASRSFSAVCSGSRPSSCCQPSAPGAVPLSGMAEPLPPGGRAGGRVAPVTEELLVSCSAMVSRKAQARKARARSTMTWTGAFAVDEKLWGQESLVSDTAGDPNSHLCPPCTRVWPGPPALRTT